MAGPNVPPPQKNKGLIAGLIKGIHFFVLVFWGQRLPTFVKTSLENGRHMEKRTVTDRWRIWGEGQRSRIVDGRLSEDPPRWWEISRWYGMIPGMMVGSEIRF